MTNPHHNPVFPTFIPMLFSNNEECFYVCFTTISYLGMQQADTEEPGFHQSRHTNPSLQRRTSKTHGLEHPSFPSLFFVPHYREKAHRASFLHNVRLSRGRAWAATSLWVKRRGRVGRRPHSSTAALPGASEMSLKVIQASRNIATIHRFTWNSHGILFFFLLALNHWKALLHMWSRVV